MTKPRSGDSGAATVWTVGAIAAAIEIIIGIMKMRAPGMTLSRMPLYAWAMLVTAFMILFAFTTLIGWSYYAERALEYLFGVRIITPFRIAWCLAILVGATMELAFVWLLADTLNALMAIPNLIALALLSPVVFALTREFFKTRGKSENNPF